MFPDGSTKIYVTGVDPTVKNDPGAGFLLRRVTVPELSVAVGSGKLTVVPPLLHTVVALKSGPGVSDEPLGPTITGGVPSTNR